MKKKLKRTRICLTDKKYIAKSVFNSTQQRKNRITDDELMRWNHHPRTQKFTSNNLNNLTQFIAQFEALFQREKLVADQIIFFHRKQPTSFGEFA